MKPLFRRVNPFVDCLSTETFIKRLSGRSISAVIGEALELSPSTATKLTWYGTSSDLLDRISSRVTALLTEQDMDVASLAAKRVGLIAGYLSGMPRIGDSPWTTESQQYFNDLASLEADLQAAASAGDVIRMREAMAKSGVGRYVKMVPIKGARQWAELSSVKEFRKECTGHSRLLTLIGVALLDHECRIAIWPDHEPRPVFAPLLPQYRLTRTGSAKGLPVRPERRLLDLMYFAITGKDAPPTDEDLFPTNTEAMVKKVLRATLSAADCFAVAREWTQSPEQTSVKNGAEADKEKDTEKGRMGFEAYFFASKVFGLLFDRTMSAQRNFSIPEMQQNYYVVWKSILDESPKLSGGSRHWDRSRLERLIRDEISFTK